MDLWRVWTGRLRSLVLKRELGPGTIHGGTLEEGEGVVGGSSRRIKEEAAEGEGDGHGECGRWYGWADMVAGAICYHTRDTADGQSSLVAGCETEF